MRSVGRQSLDNVFGTIESNYRAMHYRHITKKRLHRINGGYKCSAEYKSEVLPYWKRFGVKPGKYWYSYYSAHSKIVDKRYIPEDIWFGKILPYYSNMQFRRACEDKCMHDIWFPNLKRPQTVAMNVAGVFYDDTRNIISKDEAVDLCLKKQKFLIKPSIDSGEGRLIRFFDDKVIDVKEINNAFDALGCNFIAQEVVKQHLTLSQLNEKSLNTIRVVSFLFQGRVYLLSSILRMGGGTSRVDNFGAGGSACEIKQGGRLGEFSVNGKLDWRTKHQNGTIFSDVTVPSYEKICNIIKAEHAKLAHFKLIGWDFAVDDEGDPVFIEYNVCPGQNELLCGPTFGDLTDAVLEDVYINKEYKNSKN
jgi:hypothetical protein